MPKNQRKIFAAIIMVIIAVVLMAIADAHSNAGPGTAARDPAANDENRQARPGG